MAAGPERGMRSCWCCCWEGRNGDGEGAVRRKTEGGGGGEGSRHDRVTGTESGREKAAKSSLSHHSANRRGGPRDRNRNPKLLLWKKRRRQRRIGPRQSHGDRKRKGESCISSGRGEQRRGRGWCWWHDSWWHELSSLGLRHAYLIVLLLLFLLALLMYLWFIMSHKSFQLLNTRTKEGTLFIAIANSPEEKRRERQRKTNEERGKKGNSTRLWASEGTASSSPRSQDLWNANTDKKEEGRKFERKGESLKLSFDLCFALRTKSPTRERTDKEEREENKNGERPRASCIWSSCARASVSDRCFELQQKAPEESRRGNEQDKEERKEADIQNEYDPLKLLYLCSSWSRISLEDKQEERWGPEAKMKGKSAENSQKKTGHWRFLPICAHFALSHEDP